MPKTINQKNNRFVLAKFIIDKILSDPNTVKKIQQFIITERGRASKEYTRIYTEVHNIIRKITSERVVILKSDGQFYYDSGLTVHDAIGIYNHNSRPEVMESVKFLYGGDTINKKALKNKYPKKLTRMILAGYGIASRSSSTTKTIQSYVSKTYSDKGNPLNSNIFTLRVSIKHDDTIPGIRELKQQSSIEEIENTEEIENLERSWYESGPAIYKSNGIPISKEEDGGKELKTRFEELSQCVSFVYLSAMKSG